VYYYYKSFFRTKTDVRIENETIWLSLDKMAQLFQRDKSTISRHIRNVFAEGELEQNSVIANFATTAADGKNYIVTYYNLDVIISVGYRVKSLRGVQFRRRWRFGNRLVISHSAAIYSYAVGFGRHSGKNNTG
jgi:hypothetical protein